MCGKSCVVVGVFPWRRCPPAGGLGDVDGGARASVDVQLGRESPTVPAERSLRVLPGDAPRRADPGTLVGLVRAICMLLWALQQNDSTMKAAVLLATAAHAAKQAVEEPAESPVACVPASLPN